MADQQIPELRVRRGSEIFDAAIKVWIGNLRKLVPFAAAVLIPFQLVSAYLLIATKPSLADTLKEWQIDLQAQADAGSTTFQWPKFTNAQIGSFTGGIILSIISTTVLAAALTAIIGRIVLRDRINGKAAVLTALLSLPKLIATSILVGLVSFGGAGVVIGLTFATKSSGLILLAFPLFLVAFWLIVRFWLAGPVVVLEQVGPVKALRRSFALTKGRWWPIFGILIASGLMTGIPSGILTQIISTLLKSLGGNNAGFEFIWAAIAGTVSTAIFTPLSAAITVFLYFDLRVRKEGFDLQRLASDFSSGTHLA
jgi:Membrane domain of glycerophosphoryl diester phosphodiesterase